MIKKHYFFVTLLFLMLLDCCVAKAYSPRLSEPSKNDIYYYTNNPFQQSGYGMWSISGNRQGNCTAYAFGRAYELLGSRPKLCTGNAGTWWNYNAKTGAYDYGATPKLGAIMVWDRYDGNRGHVAVVEKINGNQVTISESHWQSIFFDTRVINANSSNYLTKMRFLGYIYIGDFQHNNPSGNVDSVSGGKKSVSVRGWAFDKDSLSTSLDIHVYIGGPAGTPEAEGHVIKANTYRPDVDNVFSSVGKSHGFEQTISTSKLGNQPVYIYAINIGQGESVLIGNGTVNIQDYNTPMGCLDSVKGGDETITIRGWAFDKDVPTSSIDIHIYVGGPAGDKNASCYIVHANQERTDVGSTYPGVGNYHGYNATINVNKIGNQAVYVYAINSGGGTHNPCIGSSSVNINKKVIPVSSLSVTRYGTVAGAGYCINTVAKLTLGVKVLPENATNKEVVWSSSDKTIAEVDQSGNVSGKKTGTVYITATSKDGKCSASALVKVVSGEIIYGDINYDGKISVTDLAQMAMAVNGSYILSNAEREIFDLNGDEEVNEADEELLNKMILKEITIFPVEQLVSKIVIEKMPKKTQYFVGEKISTSGLVVKAYYCDGTSKNITNFNISGNTLTSGEKTITLSYKEKTVTKTVGYKIRVIENDLCAIKIVKAPNKTEYIEGDCFNAEGIIVKAYYLDGSTKMIDSFSYEKNEALLSRDNQIDIFYTEDGVVCHTYQEITVKSICDYYGHEWGNYEYLENDIHFRKCIICGKEESEKCSKSTRTILPTCLNEGYKEQYCDVCGFVEVSDYKEQLCHTWNEGIIIEGSTCVKTGNKNYTCRDCGEIKIEKIGKMQHTEVIDKAILPTCTETGLSEGSHCSVCGKIIREQQIVKPSGHKYDNGVITIIPTNENTGLKTYMCTECGKLYTEVIPATGANNDSNSLNEKNDIESIYLTTDNYYEERESKNNTEIIQDRENTEVKGVGELLFVSKGIYEITVTGDKPEVALIGTHNAAKIEIPEVIIHGGVTYKVTSIANETFKNNKHLKNVVIGKNIRKIGKSAFCGCKKLKKIIIKSKCISKIGKYAFKNINKNAIINCPKEKNKEYKRLIRNQKWYKFRVVTTKMYEKNNNILDKRVLDNNNRKKEKE